MTLGDAAQVAARHCPNERTLVSSQSVGGRTTIITQQFFWQWLAIFQ